MKTGLRPLQRADGGAAGRPARLTGIENLNESHWSAVWFWVLIG